MREYVLLWECASVFRCQIQGKKTGDADADAALKNRMLFREILPGNINPATGFVDASGATIMEIPLSGKAQKGILQLNDIVCAHVGLRAKLGKTGLVVKDSPIAMPGGSLCIVRCEKLDPIWLFYYLKRRAAWQNALAAADRQKQYNKTKIHAGNATGGSRTNPRPTSVMSLSIEDIRHMEIRLPAQAEIDGINAAHQEILAHDEKMRQAARQIEEIIGGNDPHLLPR